jgi:formiminotetrahydrofolate cyclodeaminase
MKACLMTQPSGPAGAQPIGEWLDSLASSRPAPGGGAAAAVTASVAAGVVEMVCAISAGKPEMASHEQHLAQVRTTARELRLGSLVLADHDGEAFTALLAAGRLPHDGRAQQASRQAAIQAATLRAATIPLEIAACGAGVARLAAQLPGRSARTVLSDVGVAATCAAAAIEAAAVNVEINLRALTDPAIRVTLSDRLARHLDTAGRARQLAAEVRREISG